MSTATDYNVANALFPATRTDLNNILLAIATMNYATGDPSTMYGGMLQWDSTASKIKLRNAGNTAWIEMMDVNSTASAVGPTSITVITAAGDLVIGTASSTATRLAVGASGTFLYSNGTTPSWRDQTYDLALISQMFN